MLIAFTETCKDPVLANILVVVKNAMEMIQIIVPIIGIVALIKIFIQLTVDPDNKKLKNAIKNWAIAIVVCFMLPMIITIVMNWLDETDKFSFSECWNYAEKNSSIEKVDEDVHDTAETNKNKTHLVN